jgi:nitroreductase
MATEDTMNFLDHAKRRFSVRKYEDKPVEREKLEQVVEAGRVAPSAVNFQPWRFIVVQDEKMKADVCASYKRDWIRKAPAVIIICGVHGEAWMRADGKDHCDIDVAIAADHMTLAAEELGLGTCWVCNFNSMELARTLDLPKGMEAAVLLPIGYPAEAPDTERHGKLRKGAEKIIFWDAVPKE